MGQIKQNGQKSLILIVVPKEREAERERERQRETEWDRERNRERQREKVKSTYYCLCEEIVDIKTVMIVIRDS